MGEFPHTDYERTHTGNNWGSKKWSPETRQKMYKLFCKHIADGYCLDSWCYDGIEGSLSYKTMLNWMKEFPDEFPPEQRESAKCKSKMYWESVVYDSAKGANEKANTASLQMVMRNKFGWDKHKDREEEGDSDVLNHFQSIMELLARKQKEKD